MRKQWVIYLATAMLAGAAGGAMLAPAPVGAVAREIVELQQSVQQLMQEQKDLQTAIAQGSAVQKTLIELSLDSVGKLSGTMGTVQNSVQDMHANSGARLDAISMQVQGTSDSMQEMLARLGKLNQQLTDVQTSIQAIDAKLDDSPPTRAGVPASANPRP